METSKFEKLENGNVLVTCNAVVDHPDQAQYLQDLQESMKSAPVGMEFCEMINDGELEFRIRVASHPKKEKIEKPSHELPKPGVNPKEEDEKKGHKGR